MVQGLGSDESMLLNGINDDGFSVSEEFPNPPPSDYPDSMNNAGYGYQSSEEGTSKRIRLSPEFNLQEEKINLCERRSPLGLKLRKTPSFVDLIEMELSQARKTVLMNNDKPQAKTDDFSSQPISEKLKASNFPASSLKIGSWERISRHEGDLIAKCYYAKRKLVWEVLEGALKSKIEIQWADISAIKATIGANQPVVDVTQLNQPPLFFQETNPQPRKHTIWQTSLDFTGGQAPIYRRHCAIFPPGALDKPYEKLLQCDQKLLMLSQRPFPSQESPYFTSNTFGFTDFPLEFNGCTPVVAPAGLGLQYPFANFASHLVPDQHQLDKFRAMPADLGVIDSDSPMSVMDFHRLDKKASNYTFGNQSTGFGDTQGGINIINNFPKGAQIRGSTSIDLSAHSNPAFYCQGYNLLNQGEATGMYSTPSSGILVQNHLQDYPQNVFSGDKTVVGLNHRNEDGTNHLEYQHVRLTNDQLMLDTTEPLGLDGGLPCPTPACWLPSQYSHGNVTMLPPTNNVWYPSVFPEQTEEEFGAVDSTQEIHHWR
ncbi:unnamed protein product [Ilex paraguariensis]|uniref:TRF2/HOY1 PH-like domain-containing protein n=1 Tax=Ilex paraguariensis TaxID=185542 RepID=A0ABC8S975_9AQUA